MHKSKLFYLIIFFIVMMFDLSFSQCSMCRAVLESSENEAMAKGINNGIAYLAFIPYLIVFVLIFFVYKSARNSD
jgi:hypothetical protein|tara:strand:+ start:989 stop:1213 length:225 start_codon:yes stop_codon:yes gene_type:complete